MRTRVGAAVLSLAVEGPAGYGRILALLAVAGTVFGLCRLHVRTMPEPVYDLPRWWYLLWLAWLPRLTRQEWRRHQ